jgi:hypothetical protein
MSDDNKTDSSSSPKDVKETVKVVVKDLGTSIETLSSQVVKDNSKKSKD